jgi:hypothetical protein
MTPQELLIFLVFVAMLVLLAPLVRYLSLGWKAKRADIMDGLNPDSRVQYFKMFCRKDPAPMPDAANIRMDQLYTRWYGRSLFIAPGMLLILVSSICLFLALGSVFRMQELPSGFVILDVGLEGAAAIAGAYLWVVDDFISRARRLDFSPADLHAGILRLAIAVPLGYSMAAIADDTVGAFVAFAVGAFPLATLMKILRRTAAAKIGYDDPGTPNGDEVVKLQGVNTAIAERLAKEDITTITQIAYCDPIKLTMRSNLTFNVVTDLMNQALAWEYLADGMDKIRPIGLRGAVEISHLLADLKSMDPDVKTRAGQVLAQVAAVLGQEQPSVLFAFEEIASDPFTSYLNAIWE